MAVGLALVGVAAERFADCFGWPGNALVAVDVEPFVDDCGVAGAPGFAGGVGLVAGAFARLGAAEARAVGALLASAVGLFGGVRTAFVEEDRREVERGDEGVACALGAAETLGDGDVGAGGELTGAAIGAARPVTPATATDVTPTAACAATLAPVNDGAAPRKGVPTSQDVGPMAHRSRGAETRKNARTTSGSNWLPLARTNSSSAVCLVIARL